MGRALPPLSSPPPLNPPPKPPHGPPLFFMDPGAPTPTLHKSLDPPLDRLIGRTPTVSAPAIAIQCLTARPVVSLWIACVGPYPPRLGLTLCLRPPLSTTPPRALMMHPPPPSPSIPCPGHTPYCPAANTGFGGR